MKKEYNKFKFINFALFLSFAIILFCLSWILNWEFNINSKYYGFVVITMIVLITLTIYTFVVIGYTILDIKSKRFKLFNCIKALIALTLFAFWFYWFYSLWNSYINQNYTLLDPAEKFGLIGYNYTSNFSYVQTWILTFSFAIIIIWSLIDLRTSIIKTSKKY